MYGSGPSSPNFLVLAFEAYTGVSIAISDSWRSAIQRRLSDSILYPRNFDFKVLSGR